MNDSMLYCHLHWFLMLNYLWFSVAHTRMSQSSTTVGLIDLITSRIEYLIN